MKTKILWRVVLVAALSFMGSSPALAQAPPHTRVDGLIHDFTAALDAAGPWEISGEFSLALNAATRKVELTGTLSMVRANTEPRSSHTHHLRMVDGEPSAIDNGVRIVGTAAITTNGSLAGFTGAPVVIELTGGSALVFSNFKITFGVPAAGHFGPDPIDGVVSLRR